MSVPSYRLEEEEVMMVCRYEVEEEKMSELDIKWYLDSSPSPWLVHLPHHWRAAQLLGDIRPTSHVSQVSQHTPHSTLTTFKLTEVILLAPIKSISMGKTKFLLDVRTLTF